MLPSNAVCEGSTRGKSAHRNGSPMVGDEGVRCWPRASGTCEPGAARATQNNTSEATLTVSGCMAHEEIQADQHHPVERLIEGGGSSESLLCEMRMAHVRSRPPTHPVRSKQQPHQLHLQHANRRRTEDAAPMVAAATAERWRTKRGWESMHLKRLHP